MPLTLRKAMLQDSALLLALRNDPVTVAMSITNKPVTEAEHDRWLVRVLCDTSWHVYVAMADVRVEAWQPEDWQPVGTGRLQESEPTVVTVSYAIGAPWRGRGYGGQVLDQLCEQAIRLGYGQIRALVRPRNTPSIRLLLGQQFEAENVELWTFRRSLF